MKARHPACWVLCLAIHGLSTAPCAAGSQAVARHAALATSSPYATQVGLRILHSGGNAVDAAVAVGFVLAVAQPQSGNIGGGGFLTYYDAAEKGVWILDFRELAPAAITTSLYQEARARTGALAAAVPGTVAGLAAMHERFGTRPWKELVAPAIQLAREGVKVDADLAEAIAEAKRERHADQNPSTASIFFPDQKALVAGTTLVQSDLAATLQRIANKGASDFYDGETSRRIIEEVRRAGGILSVHDLREYKPVWRAPIRLSFGSYDVYTTPPPSGGLMIASALKILGSYDLNSTGYQSAKSLHLIAEAMRRAAIDRDHYVADPATARIPLRDLLSDERASQWRASINPDRVTPTATLTESAPTTTGGNHTTHFTIVDVHGNIAAVTTTLGDNLGGGFVVPSCGFFLNDSMNDFGRTGTTPNGVAPRKRMATSMSPTIVFRNRKPLLALGTPGGGTIGGTILQVLLSVLIYRQPLANAVAAPRYDQQATPEELSFEKELAPKQTIDKLLAMGHSITAMTKIGDVQAVMLDEGKLIAVSDPRHGGAAGGY